MHHEPVMLKEVLTLIKSHASHAKILDGTLGLGGYTEAILQNFPESFVLGIDRDEEAVKFSRQRLQSYSNFSALHKNFSKLYEIPDAGDFDAYVFDLGVSNMQLSLPERGFSFQVDGELDMRMNQEDSLTAAEVLRTCNERTLTKIFRDYGEEKYANLIASAVKRSKIPVNTTSELVELIRQTLPQPVQRKMGTHPARRIFQALRIYVNNETGELERLLEILPAISRKEALVIVVSYHSLEDRIVKLKFRQWQSENKGRILTRHPLTPSVEEIERNYKARSGKLRAFCLETGKLEL